MAYGLKEGNRAAAVTCTCAVVVDHSDGSPLEEVNQVQNGSAEGREVRVQADVVGIPVVRHLMLPFRLDVGHSQSIADGLHRVGRRAVRRPKYGGHSQGQLVTCWVRMRQEA